MRPITTLLALAMGFGACAPLSESPTERFQNLITSADLAQFELYWLPGDVEQVIPWSEQLGPIQIFLVRAEWDCGRGDKKCRPCTAKEPCRMRPEALPPIPLIDGADATVHFAIPPPAEGGFYLVQAKDLLPPAEKLPRAVEPPSPAVVWGAPSLVDTFPHTRDDLDRAQASADSDAVDVACPEPGWDFISFMFSCKKNPPVPFVQMYQMITAAGTSFQGTSVAPGS